VDGLTMDTLEAIELSEPQLIEVAETIELVRPERKRESGYARMKRRALLAEAQKALAADLTKDIAALEALVGTLLNHLDRVARTNMTDQDRERILKMVNDIRGHLATEESG
jgi:hypothetical protein